MDVSIRAITAQCSEKIEPSAAASTFWAFPPGYEADENSTREPLFDKQVWIQRVLMEWGICGYTAFVGTGDTGTRQVPAATVFVAPARYMQGLNKLPTAPISPDAILLSTVHVALPYMGLYLEHQLIDTVLTEAHRRGVKAVEAFARIEDYDDEHDDRTENSTQAQNHGEAQSAGESEFPNGASTDHRSTGSTSAAAGQFDEAVGGVDRANVTGKPEYSALDSLKYVPEAYRGWRTATESHTADEDELEYAPMLSGDILEEEGFTIVQHHPRFPRYRFEINGPQSLFGNFAEEDHAVVNGSTALPTVLGGNQTPSPVGNNLLMRKLLL